MSEKLHIVSVHFNPKRFKSRARLTREFINYMSENDDVELYIVEAAFGGRDFEVTDAQNPNHIRLRTDQELWNKESLINIGLARLPIDAKYCGWIDADICFTRPDWANEAMEALQHFEIIQPWSFAIDLGPQHQIIGTAKSFASYYAQGSRQNRDVQKYGYWHSGYAWCARRSALNKLGGPLCSGPLIDYAVLGSADFYIANALIGKLDDNLYNDVANADVVKKGFTKPYLDALFMWQRRAQTLNRNVGFCHGSIEHFFHGNKKQRYYNTRENILIQNDFNPFFDLRRDINGLFQWVVESPRQMRLRDEVRRYFDARNEDRNDLG